MTFEPSPTNPIGWLVSFLLGLIGLFLFAAVPVSSTVQTLPDTPSGRPARPSVSAPQLSGAFPVRANAEYFSVEHLEVVIRESAPPQVSVDVSGYWSNGCSAEPDIDMVAEGNNVTIALSRTLPPDVMCTMALQAAEIQIDITELLVKNNVRSGQFAVTVNGVSVVTSF